MVGLQGDDRALLHADPHGPPVSHHLTIVHPLVQLCQEQGADLDEKVSDQPELYWDVALGSFRETHQSNGKAIEVKIALFGGRLVRHVGQLAIRKSLIDTLVLLVRWLSSRSIIVGLSKDLAHLLITSHFLDRAIWAVKTNL